MNTNELIEILTYHKNKYPQMEVSDVIKLVYQNEFGGGHLITNPLQSLTYLTYEYNSINKDYSMPLYEEIGNNLIRLNLKAIDNNILSLEKINDIFVSSSRITKGTISSFLSKIEIVKTLCKNNFFTFSYETLINYLNEYEKHNYPMVSHSKTYKDNYDPAYRVISKSFINEIKAVI